MILTILFYGLIIGIGLCIIIGGFYLVITLISGAAAGIGAGKQAIKNRGFYEDCISRGFTEPILDNMEKINLVGKLHHIDNGYDLFKKMYEEKNRPAKEKKKFHLTPISIGAIVGAVVGCIGLVYFFYYKYTTDFIDLNYDLGTFVVPGICGAMIGGIVGGVIGYVIEIFLEKKYVNEKNKEDIEERLRRLEK